MKMDGVQLKKLADLISLQEPNREQQKKNIDKLFHRKSSKTIIHELSNFLRSVPDKREHNKIVLTVVIALLYRRYSDADLIEKELKRHQQLPILYGGLMRFLSGKAESGFGLIVHWSDESFSNRYEFLNRFRGQFGYYEYSALFYAIEMIEHWSVSKFEILQWKDASKLILLNMYSYTMESSISTEMMKQLVSKGDDLQAAIGFAAAVDPVNICVRNWETWKRVGNQSKYTKAGLQEQMGQAMEEFQSVFACADKKRQCGFLIDYLLVERNYPVAFGYWLLEKQFQNLLQKEIMEGKKLRGLKEISKLTDIISTRRMSREFDLVQNKSPFYQAITGRLLRFVKDRTGVYLWENKEIEYFSNVCKCLPKKYRKRLKEELIKQRESLMLTSLDQMTRFSIYLKDERCREIIDGMIEILDSSFKARYDADIAKRKNLKLI